MEFIKQKIANLYLGITAKHRAKHLNARGIIRSLLRHPEVPVDSVTMEKLIVLCSQQSQYREAVKCLIDRLQEFDYKPSIIRTVAKSISIILYLIKSQLQTFSIDFRSHQVIFSKLQKVNTHYFHNIYTSDKKELEYNLELIRQRVILIRKLLNNEQLLFQERIKNKQIKIQAEMASELFSPSQSTQKSFKVAFKRGSQQKVGQAIQHFQIKQVTQKQQKTKRKDRNTSFF